jgi:aminoglycoside/choline kinase family phosphotransferase
MRRELSDYLAEREGARVLAALTPDASTREYYRIKESDRTLVACLYPEPFDRNSVHPYLDVTRLLQNGGVRVPQVESVDYERGLILLEDVGDTLLRTTLQTSDEIKRTKLLETAIGIIADIQMTTESARATDSIAARLSFDFEKLNWELNFFLEHYVVSYRGGRHPASDALRAELALVGRELSHKAVTVCHRDYHAANLMVASDGELVVIDHQDARMGSISYDIVSLLLDRIESAPEDDEIGQWINYFLSQRNERGLPRVSEDEFWSEFRLQSIQRCLKAIGTFSYQTAVRGKSGYEQYIGPMMEVTLRNARTLGGYPELVEFLQREIRPQTL